MAQMARERNANTWGRRAAVDAWSWRLATWPHADLGSRDYPTVLQNVLTRNCDQSGVGWKLKEQVWANQPGQAAPGSGDTGLCHHMCSSKDGQAVHCTARGSGWQTLQVPTFMMIMFQGLIPTKHTRTTS